MVKETKRETLENFKIFMSSLYESQSWKENDVMFKQFEKDLNNCNGDTVTRIELSMTMADGTQETEVMLLSKAAWEGVDMPEDVASFEVVVKVYSSVKNGNVTMGNTVRIFKSKKFVVKANAKKLKEKEDNVVVIKDIDMYQIKNNNRIRFGRRQELEQ